MRALAALTLATAAVLAGAAAPAHAGPPWVHCDEQRVNVNCLDQGDDGTIYQCVVWWERIEPQDNPTCFPTL